MNVPSVPNGVQEAGFEPAASAWKAEVLAVNTIPAMCYLSRIPLSAASPPGTKICIPKSPRIITAPVIKINFSSPSILFPLVRCGDAEHLGASVCLLLPYHTHRYRPCALSAFIGLHRFTGLHDVVYPLRKCPVATGATSCLPGIPTFQCAPFGPRTVPDVGMTHPWRRICPAFPEGGS